MTTQATLARRAAGITGSVIDDSTSLLARQQHDIVRFAMGSPAPEAIPSEELAALVADVLAPGTADAYDYGPSEGEADLRLALQEFLAAQGSEPPADERLLITSGGMQGLDLACKLFVDPGALVITESPTYTNGTAVIRSYEGRVLEAPVDDDGMVVDALPDLVARAGATPSVIYVIPNFQNPSGTTMSLPRRERLVELAQGWGALILDDDPYELLRFDGESRPGFAELARGRAPVISVRTFSKILAPGLRVGWVVAEPDVVERMVAAKQGMDTCTNVPMQRVTAAFIANGDLGRHLERIRAEYFRRKCAMQEALGEHLADAAASWTDPDGGFFLWVTFPAEVATETLFPIALREGVAFIPGPAFSASGRFGNALRLCFASTDRERTFLGVRRLAVALERLREEGRVAGSLSDRR